LEEQMVRRLLVRCSSAQQRMRLLRRGEDCHRCHIVRALEGMSCPKTVYVVATWSD
jgi:hypothetical protein